MSRDLFPIRILVAGLGLALAACEPQPEMTRLAADPAPEPASDAEPAPEPDAAPRSQ